MAERTRHDGPGHEEGRLLGRLGELARAELQLAQRHLRQTARETAKGAALGGAGLAVGALGLGALGVAAGLALAGRPARRVAIVALAFVSMAAFLAREGLRALPTDALEQLKRDVRAQVDALRHA